MAGLVITVGGVNLTSYVDVSSISISEVATSGVVGTASFTAEDATGTITIDTKDAVSIVDDGTTIFAGEVVDSADSIVGLGIQWKVACQDYNIYLDETVVATATYSSGESDSDIIADIFTTYRSDIDSSTYVATIDDPMEDISFAGLTLREILDDLAARTGGRYYVDYTLNLHWFSTEANAAAFGLSSEPDYATTWSYGGFSRTRSAGQLANRVYVLGQEVADWVEDAASIVLYGERHAVSRDQRISTAQGITDRGSAILDRYDLPRATYELWTNHIGLRAGMSIQVVHSKIPELYKAGTNLHTNPSFEVDTTGWTTFGTNTIERKSWVAYIGTYSCKATYQDDTRFMTDDVTLVGATQYYARAMLYVPGDWDGGDIRVLFNNFSDDTTSIVTTWTAGVSPTNAWFEIVAESTIGADLTGNILISTTSAPTAGRFIYIDRCFLYAGTDAALPYIDGDQPGCTWSGTAHASTSSRDPPVYIRRMRTDLLGADGDTERRYHLWLDDEPPTSESRARSNEHRITNTEVIVNDVNNTVFDTDAPAAPAFETSNLATGVDIDADGHQLVYVQATWGDVSDADLSYFQIQGSTSSDFSGYTMTRSHPEDGSRLERFLGLLGGTLYYWRVRAVDWVGNKSAWSTTRSITSSADTTPPADPTGVTATATPASVHLVWNANSELDLAGYDIQRKPDGGAYATIETSFRGTFFIDNTAAAGTAYWYKVRAVDTSGNASGYAEIAGAVTPAVITGDWADLSLLGWAHSLAFSASDNDTVAWAGGDITLPSGTTYSIDAGNTGNMAATTYIYLNTAVSTTVLQTTTTASTATGANKLMIAVAENVAAGKDAIFQVFGGAGVGVLITAGGIAAGTITADEIAANTITASEIAAGTITTDEILANTIVAGNIAANTITAAEIAAATITATELNVATLSAISANMGTITAGTVTGATIRTAATPAARVQMDTANGLQAYNATPTQTVSVDVDGSGYLAAGNIVWNTAGALSVVAMTAGGGTCFIGTAGVMFTAGDVAADGIVWKASLPSGNTKGYIRVTSTGALDLVAGGAAETYYPDIFIRQECDNPGDGSFTRTPIRIAPTNAGNTIQRRIGLYSAGDPTATVHIVNPVSGSGGEDIPVLKLEQDYTGGANQTIIYMDQAGGERTLMEIYGEEDSAGSPNTDATIIVSSQAHTTWKYQIKMKINGVLCYLDAYT